MPRSLPALLLAVLCAAATPARADDEPAAPAQQKSAPRRGAMAMKAFVCRAIEEGKGKSGQELADVVEQFIAQMSRSNYRLTSLLAGDPPIGCFASRADPSKLPRGAR